MIGVIIVNFKSYHLTARCVSSLIPFLANHDHDVVICIDNNSAKDSLDSLRDALLTKSSEEGHCSEIDDLYTLPISLNGFAIKVDRTTVIIHKAERNLGFGAGCNIGVQIAAAMGCTYLWFLNNDAQPIKGNLELLKQTCRPEVGKEAIVGTSIGGKHSQRDNEVFGFHLNPVSGVTRELYFQQDDSDVRELMRNEFLSGCSMFMTLATFESVGGFDEEFFLYYEETDWQTRAVKKGHPLKARRDVGISHDVGGSIGSDFQNHKRSLLSELCCIRARTIFAVRHFRRRQFLWKFFCLLIAFKRLLFFRYSEALHIARVTFSSSEESLRYILSLHPSIRATVFPNREILRD